MSWRSAEPNPSLVVPGRAPASTDTPAAWRRPANACTASLVARSTGATGSSAQSPIRSSRRSTGSGSGSDAPGTPRKAPNPRQASSISDRSGIDRPRGPITPRSNEPNVPGGPGMCPRSDTSPSVGFKPKTPLKCAGTRIDPPMSEPTSPRENPHETDTPAPPDDPPAVRSGSQRVPSHAVDVVVGLVITSEERHVRLGVHDPTRGPKSTDDIGVRRRNVLRQARRTRSGHQALGLIGVLDRERHSRQGADVVPPGPGRIDGIGIARSPGRHRRPRRRSPTG